MTNDLDMFSKFSFKTLESIEQSQSFDGNPIYSLLHEPIYCQGYVSLSLSSSTNSTLPRHAAKWSAARIVDQHPHFFSWDHVKSVSAETPLYFTGEMVR